MGLEQGHPNNRGAYRIVIFILRSIRLYSLLCTYIL